jgi:hypothetical protein
MQSMAISRLDLPDLKLILESLFRFLGEQNFVPPDLHTNLSWNPPGPPRQVSPSEKASNWSPPNFWVVFCEKLSEIFTIDPMRVPPWEWMCHALLYLAIDNLAPTGFEPTRENSDIVDSDLDNIQKDTLQEFLNELLNRRTREALIQRQPVTTRTFRNCIYNTLVIFRDAPTPPPANTERSEGGSFPQYVTLDQIAACVGRKKKTLERALNKPNSDMPKPDVEGGGGKPHQWIWTRIRPWLIQTYDCQLPERFFTDRH